MMNFEHEDSKVDKEFKLTSLKTCCRFVIMAIRDNPKIPVAPIYQICVPFNPC